VLFEKVEKREGMRRRRPCEGLFSLGIWRGLRGSWGWKAARERGWKVLGRAQDLVSL
jgi:hypothetical protein